MQQWLDGARARQVPYHMCMCMTHIHFLNGPVGKVSWPNGLLWHALEECGSISSECYYVK